MDGCNNFSGWLPMWNQCCGVTLENDVIIGWFYFTYICFNELSISATASMAFNPLLPKKKKKRTARLILYLYNELAGNVTKVQKYYFG